MDHIVGIGEYGISNNKEDLIKTFALSTCVAVTLYCPSRTLLAMAHVMLPNHSIEKNEQQLKKSKFADTAIDFLINIMTYTYGVTDYSEIEAGLFGGIYIGKQDFFGIGIKNSTILANRLNELGIKCVANDTGGNVSRTLVGHVDTGVIEISRQNIAKRYLKN